jgi:transcriptional regulator with XRE-family HTH domain
VWGTAGSNSIRGGSVLDTVTFSGERLRAARVAAGLRREHLALAVDRGMARVGSWERGESEPTIAQLGVLAHVLGVEVGELLSQASDR